MTTRAAEDSFTGTGNGTAVEFARGAFNLSINGGSGTVVLERSFDDGTTYFTVKEYTADAEEVGDCAEEGILYRLRCSAFTSGTIACRLSQ